MNWKLILQLSLFGLVMGVVATRLVRPAGAVSATSGT